MASELYSQGLIFLDGILLAEAPDFEVSYNTNNQPVVTMAKGFSGITPGAGQADVTINEAIPRAGMELDFYKRAKERTPIKITGWRGSKKMQLEGFIMTIAEKHGVNSNASATITCACGEPTEA